MYSGMADIYHDTAAGSVLLSDFHLETYADEIFSALSPEKGAVLTVLQL